MIDLKQTAIGILSRNHWPAHLGLNTDAERIEWLARQLEQLADEATDAEALEKRADDAEEKRDSAEDEIKELRGCSSCELCSDHKETA